MCSLWVEAPDRVDDGGTVNGTLFNRFRSGYIWFQNAAALSSNFRESRDFTRVLEHELGHTIGLGHTQDSVANPTSNIMYPSCCGPSTPIAPAIGADDLAGLTFIYPASGCTYALSSNSTQVPALASSFSVTVTTQAGCVWSVTGNPPWVTPNPSTWHRQWNASTRDRHQRDDERPQRDARHRRSVSYDHASRLHMYREPDVGIGLPRRRECHDCCGSQLM